MTDVRTMEIAALAGLSIRLVDGTLVKFVAPNDGTSGDREPRRPKPTPMPARHTRA